MHIAVNLGVQKIASFQVDNFLPQEIDHELNIAMDRFIKQRYNPMSNRYRRGFEQSQKRIDDLRNLVVDRTLPTFYAGDTVQDDMDFSFDRAALPNDYLFLVNVLARLNYNCEPAQIIINTSEYKYIKISLTPPETGYVLVDVQTQLQSGQSNESLIQNESGLTMNDLMDNTNYTSGTPVLSLENLSTNSATVETSPTNDSNEIFVRLEGEDYDGDLLVTQVWKHPVTNEVIIVQPQEGPIVVTVTKRTTNNAKTKTVGCMYVQHDDLYMLLNNPFNKTKDGYPKYTIQENFIDVHTDDSFVVNDVKIKYIRRPSRIDKFQGVGCELPEHTHQEIVEMAIKSILEGIQDPRYTSQNNETLESE